MQQWQTLGPKQGVQQQQQLVRAGGLPVVGLHCHHPLPPSHAPGAHLRLIRCDVRECVVHCAARCLCQAVVCQFLRLGMGDCADMQPNGSCISMQ